MILGIDYASVDGNAPPNFPALRDQGGMSFVYIRGTWGTYVDPDLQRDGQAAADAGLAVGTYMFLRYPELGHAAPSPEDQAFAFLWAKRPPCVLPPVIDIEFPGRGRVDTGLSVAEALDWIGKALNPLTHQYKTVMIYTSARVWEEDLNNAASNLGDYPLWVKTPYVVPPRRPMITNLPYSKVSDHEIPPPWHGAAWIQQFQGDAIGVPGMTSTVDVNRFGALISTKAGLVDNTDPRADWVNRRLAGRTVQAFQEGAGLTPDGIIGPRTFGALCTA